MWLSGLRRYRRFPHSPATMPSGHRHEAPPKGWANTPGADVVARARGMRACARELAMTVTLSSPHAPPPRLRTRCACAYARRDGKSDGAPGIGAHLLM